MSLPVILQSERSECGLACLAMVAGFYGYRCTLRELRSKFQLSLHGMTLRRLRDCAGSLGLTSRGVRLELEDLPQLRSPAILHWEFDHFVVLKSLNRRGITIIDPALGQRRFTLAEASKRFTGIALELAPTPAFKKRKTAESVKLSAFFTALHGLGSPLAAVFTLTVLMQMFALAMPLNVQLVVDQGIRQSDMNIVVALATGFGLLALISTVTDYLRSMLVLHVGNVTALRMVAGLMNHLLRLPDTWFEARHPGDVLSRFGSIDPVRNFLTTGAFAMLVDAFMVIGALTMLMIYAWDLTLVLCGFLGAIALMTFASYGRLRNLTHETIAAGALESSMFIENVQRHRAIKLLGMQSNREDTWGERYVDSLNADAHLGRFNIYIRLAGSALGNIESVVMLVLGAYKVTQGDFTLGMLFAFNAYGGMFSDRVRTLIAAGLSLRMLNLHLERVADVGLEQPESPSEHRGAQVELQGALSVQSVRFAYNKEEGAVLQDLTFSIAPGEFAVVTGDSGQGKTTMIKLLAKLCAPSSGKIEVDGVDLRQVDSTHYRRQLGVVMQDDDLFSGTLLENIAASEEQPDEARVEWAAKLACIHEDIQKMPMQYLTLAGHMGSALSGGQRQRIMIARAIYRQPRLILLDEGTAHLNDELQHEVLTNLKNLKATVIAVSHDPRVEAFASKRLRL
ncbi:MAG: peptidase domain-containing ABC transporter [Gammaproteobacteria bacterium]|nr:peptidase domain-containing ABC transporter [Gammaproteobacteria bacterium]